MLRTFLAAAVFFSLLRSVDAQQVCIERRWHYGVKEWVRGEPREAGEKEGNAWRFQREVGWDRYERSCPPGRSE
jgi:hypothetical protein